MKLILCSKTNSSRCFACISGPKHVCNKLVKLNEIEFQEKILVIDEAKRNSLTPSSTPLLQIPVDESQKFQWQIPFNRTQVVPGDKGFPEVTKSQISNLYDNLIFTARIPKGI